MTNTNFSIKKRKRYHMNQRVLVSFSKIYSSKILLLFVSIDLESVNTVIVVILLMTISNRQRRRFQFSEIINGDAITSQ